MADNVWYPFYVGDYSRKTAHLSLLEHGAYRLLLDHYYATRSPLPDDQTKLFRICRARTPSERQAVLSTVAEFFTKDGSLLRQEKCDSLIEKQLKYKETQSANAKRRHSDGSAMAVLNARVPKSKSDKVEEVPPIGGGGGAERDEHVYPGPFEAFWELFPRQRRGSKEKAFKAWKRALTRSNEEKIYEGLHRYSRSDDVNRGFAKGAESWLNDDGWENEYLPAGTRVQTPGSRFQPSQASKSERARAAANRALADLGVKPYQPGEAG